MRESKIPTLDWIERQLAENKHERGELNALLRLRKKFDKASEVSLPMVEKWDRPANSGIQDEEPTAVVSHPVVPSLDVASCEAPEGVPGPGDDLSDDDPAGSHEEPSEVPGSAYEDDPDCSGQHRESLRSALCQTPSDERVWESYRKAEVLKDSSLSSAVKLRFGNGKNALSVPGRPGYFIRGGPEPKFFYSSGRDPDRVSWEIEGQPLLDLVRVVMDLKNPPVH